ncbi:hypothetical protein HYALB_00010189 [Hymenoscyphus albidus]|uniref:Uncharacterized protein n=1 Tax=Hymenoscyphus albidus TaxID=595503 RepID=A0A9N9Q107_9HELO|nr:hypothetical protein HYALB_00010189 [Hymenoscyphus albidus]
MSKKNTKTIQQTPPLPPKTDHPPDISPPTVHQSPPIQLRRQYLVSTEPLAQKIERAIINQPFLAIALLASYDLSPREIVTLRACTIVADRAVVLVRDACFLALVVVEGLGAVAVVVEAVAEISFPQGAGGEVGETHGWLFLRGLLWWWFDFVDVDVEKSE